MPAIFTSEYVLGGMAVAVLLFGGAIWRKTRKWNNDDKEGS
jgi:hypothetical protein